MATEESNRTKRIMLGVNKLCKLFRNNTGRAYQGSGKPIRVQKPTKMLMVPGDVLLKCARIIDFGLMKGSGDTIGITTKIVDDAFIEKYRDKPIGILTTIEVKTPTGKLSPEQKHWIKRIKELGGLAGMATDVEGALKIINDE